MEKIDHPSDRDASYDLPQSLYITCCSIEITRIQDTAWTNLQPNILEKLTRACIENSMGEKINNIHHMNTLLTILKKLTCAWIWRNTSFKFIQFEEHRCGKHTIKANWCPFSIQLYPRVYGIQMNINESMIEFIFHDHWRERIEL